MARHPVSAYVAFSPGAETDGQRHECLARKLYAKFKYDIPHSGDSNSDDENDNDSSGGETDDEFDGQHAVVISSDQVSGFALLFALLRTAIVYGLSSP